MLCITTRWRYKLIKTPDCSLSIHSLKSAVARTVLNVKARLQSLQTSDREKQLDFRPKKTSSA